MNSITALIFLTCSHLSAETWIPLFSTKANAEPFETLLARSNGVSNINFEDLYSISETELKILPNWSSDTAPFCFLMTTKKFKNYNLKFEYRWGEKRFAPKHKAKKGSGLLFAIHNLKDRQHWPSCLELQIQQNDVCDLWVLDCLTTPIAENGKAIHFADNKRFANKATKYTFQEKEGWNTILLKVRNANAEFYLNGHLVNKLINTKTKNNLPLLSGHIAFQIEGAQVSYRNILIKELEKPQTSKKTNESP